MEKKCIKLRAAVFEALAGCDVGDVDLTKRETRIKIGKCCNFFATIFLGNEIMSHQFKSIVDMSSSLRNVTFNTLTMMTSQQRKKLFRESQKKNVPVNNLFTMIQRRHLQLKKCPVCEWRKNVRQLTNRNDNISICIAKERANLWKICHDLPPIACFSLNHYHEHLQVQFSVDAQMYLDRNENKKIDIQVSENTNMLLYYIFFVGKVNPSFLWF